MPFLQDNRAELSCDLALICDTGLFESATPAITTMLRGLAKAEFTMHAASRDLHSGMYGGLARNPLHVLTQILAGLHDDQGRVQVPGFYDDVTELPDALRAQWQNLAFDHAGYLGDVGLSVPAGEADRTPLEMIWSRPTAEVNGLWGGYTGARIQDRAARRGACQGQLPPGVGSGSGQGADRVPGLGRSATARRLPHRMA